MPPRAGRLEPDPGPVPRVPPATPTLVLLTKRHTYLRGGQFEPEAMIELLCQMLEQALGAMISPH